MTRFHSKTTNYRFNHSTIYHTQVNGSVGFRLDGSYALKKYRLHMQTSVYLLLGLFLTSPLLMHSLITSLEIKKVFSLKLSDKASWCVSWCFVNLHHTFTNFAFVIVHGASINHSLLCLSPASFHHKLALLAWEMYIAKSFFFLTNKEREEK